MLRPLVVASIILFSADLLADPPLAQPVVDARVAVPAARVDLTVQPPVARVVATPPRFEWAPAPQPSFGMFTASADVGGGLMTAPDGTPLSGGGWELGVSGGWGPTRFAELRLRASLFTQPDRSSDADGDQQDDVDERNLLGMFLGGGLRLRLPLYTGIDEGHATRFLLFSEGLVGLQPLFSYGDVVSSGPALEITNGLQISHVRRRDGLTRGVELFVRYRQGLGDGNRDLNAVLFGLGYATEWSAYVPRVPPPQPARSWSGPAFQTIAQVPSPRVSVDAEGAGSLSGGSNLGTSDAEAHGHAEFEIHHVGPAEPPGRPLGFNLHLGGDCAAGEGLWASKTVGWSPWRILVIELQTAYFSIDHSVNQTTRDEPNVQGLFAGVGPRLHLVADQGLRLGVWTSAKLGWAQVVSAPAGRDGSGLGVNLAVGLSFGIASPPFSAGDVSVFVARQFGISGNDDDVGMLYGGIAVDYQLGPHRVPPPAPVRVTRPADPEPTPIATAVRSEAAAPAPAPAAVEVEPVRTRTELVVEPLRPSRPWPVGFAIGAELGYSYFPRSIGPRFENGGLDLGLGVGFVASPYFEIRTRLGLLTRADAAETGGDDIEAVTLSAGPRVRIPIRTVKDNQIALILEALGGWVSTVDPVDTSIGSGAILEGAIGVRLPASAGLTLGARGLWALSDAARDLTSIQLTLGGEFEMGPRFRHPVELPEIPRVEVPERVDVQIGAQGELTTQP